MALQTISLSSQDRGLKSVYSNAVDAARSEALKQYVTQHLGFEHVAAKQGASFHIHNQDLNTSLVVVFTRSG